MEPLVLDPQAKCLAFRVGEREYGVDLPRVREIAGALETAPLAGAPEWLLGTAQLRGRAVPVVDLRRRLGLPPGRLGQDHCVLVVFTGRTGQVGLLVDAVNEVLWMGEGQVALEPRRDVCVRGVLRARGREVLLLDLRRLVRPRDLRGMERSLEGRECSHV